MIIKKRLIIHGIHLKTMNNVLIKIKKFTQSRKDLKGEQYKTSP